MIRSLRRLRIVLPLAALSALMLVSLLSCAEHANRDRPDLARRLPEPSEPATAQDAHTESGVPVVSATHDVKGPTASDGEGVAMRTPSSVLKVHGWPTDFVAQELTTIPVPAGENGTMSGMAAERGLGVQSGQQGGMPAGGGFGGMAGGFGGWGAAGGPGGTGAYGNGPTSNFVTIDGYGQSIGYGWSETITPVQGQRGAGRLEWMRSNLGVDPSVARRYEEYVRTNLRIPLVDLVNVRADEIWIISRTDTSRPQAVGPEYDTPGTGSMLATIDAREVPLPLKHTDVQGQISGYIATVHVTQQFHNPYSEKIEAVYVFPLPQNAAVNEFVMIIGDRKIRGIIREREEAEQIYAQARSQGLVASLLTQERPNIFTQKVANIEPGKDIDVDIKYFNTLAYADGWYEFIFPMVVGPRYNPPGTRAGVGAVARGRQGISRQSTEVPYLAPNERSGHDIALAVDVDAGVEIEEIVCPSHAIRLTSPTSETARVEISPLDTIPNKDFVLRYKVAGETIKSALVTHRDERGGYFSLMLYPPDELSRLRRAPMEMVFVLDCSGSMSGQPIAKAKEAIIRALQKLEPGDTFQVIRFSQSASQFGPTPVPATAENVRKAIAYVEQLQGSGGTQMIEGVKAALDFPHDPQRFRLVSFMTDGYIGNEADILEAVYDKLGDSRIFAFGVGSSVNRYLLDRMAKLGRGAVAYIGLNESGAEIVDLFYDRISHPALCDVEIDWGALDVADVYPRQINDLFVGRPVIVTGRFNRSRNTTIRVSGTVAGEDQEIRIPVRFSRDESTHPGIASVWARRKIEELASRATYENDRDLPGEIKDVALDYSLMSAYTAFVAVDSSRQTAGAHGVTVAVPVPVPNGVRYETTVQR